MSDVGADKNRAQKLVNPCVRNCCLDYDDICLGCFRTLDEILEWRALTEEQREQVIIESNKRRIAKAR